MTKLFKYLFNTTICIALLINSLTVFSQIEKGISVNFSKTSSINAEGSEFDNLTIIDVENGGKSFFAGVYFRFPITEKLGFTIDVNADFINSNRVYYRYYHDHHSPSWSREKLHIRSQFLNLRTPIYLSWTVHETRLSIGVEFSALLIGRVTEKGLYSYYTEPFPIYKEIDSIDYLFFPSLIEFGPIIKIEHKLHKSLGTEISLGYGFNFINEINYSKKFLRIGLGFNYVISSNE